MQVADSNDCEPLMSRVLASLTEQALDGAVRERRFPAKLLWLPLLVPFNFGEQTTAAERSKKAAIRVPILR